MIGITKVNEYILWFDWILFSQSSGFFFSFSPKPYLCSNRFLINCTILFFFFAHCFMLSMCLLRMGQEHVKMKRVTIATLKLRIPLMQRNQDQYQQGYDSKNKGYLLQENVQAKKSEYFCSQENIFSSISLFCVIAVWGLLEGVEFYQMLVLLKCTWLLNYKQLM